VSTPLSRRLLLKLGGGATARARRSGFGPGALPFSEPPLPGNPSGGKDLEQAQAGLRTRTRAAGLAVPAR
jgi:hypothetical protein